MCIFCKVINKEIESERIFENDRIIVIKDIEPQAPTHFLIIPKEHINSIKEIEEKHQLLMGELFLVARKVAEEKNLRGYKLIVNVGKEGGQVIDHIHMHLLSQQSCH